MKMIPQGLSSSLKATEDTTKIEQIKRAYPAEIKFLETGKTYRPISLRLEELQFISAVIRKGGHNG